MPYRFVKLSCDIPDSTIWAEDDGTFRIWMYLMVRADRFGIVHTTIPGIANACRKTIGQVEDALQKFEEPDPYSKNPEHQGRRMERIIGGWRLLNYQHYRDLPGGDPDWQAQRNKQKQKAYRDRKKANIEQNVTGSVTGSAVTSDENPVTITTEAEAYSYSEAEHKTLTTSVDLVTPEKKNGAYHPPQNQLNEIYEVYPRHVAPRIAKASIEKAILRTIKGECGNPAREPIDAARFLYRQALSYARSQYVKTAPKNFIPHPSTWFNQSRYCDDPQEWTQSWKGQTNNDRNTRTRDKVRDFLENDPRNPAGGSSTTGFDLFGPSSGTNGRIGDRLLLGSVGTDVGSDQKPRGSSG